MVGAPERTAVLVIRAWLEDEGREPALRARLTSALDATCPKETETVAAASEDEIVQVVRSWVRGFTAGGVTPP